MMGSSPTRARPGNRPATTAANTRPTCGGVSPGRGEGGAEQDRGHAVPERPGRVRRRDPPHVHGSHQGQCTARPAAAPSPTRIGSLIFHISRLRATTAMTAAGQSVTVCRDSTTTAPAIAPAAAAVAALDERLDLRVVAVPHEPPAGQHHAKVDRGEDGHRGDDRARPPGGQVPDERRGDDHRPRCDQPYRHRVQELRVGQPVVLVNHAVTQERDDGQAAAEDERTGLNEEPAQRDQHPTGRCGGSEGVADQLGKLAWRCRFAGGE
jgi:hypothetical protein